MCVLKGDFELEYPICADSIIMESVEEAMIVNLITQKSATNFINLGSKIKVTTLKDVTPTVQYSIPMLAGIH